MPTLPSIAMAEVIAFLESTPWWSRSGSATCHPVRYTGFREVIGSCKIIAISVTFVRSWPLNRTLPPTILPGRCSRMMLSAVTDLPQPDSPTMPSVSPGFSSKETPSTALTMPSLVAKTVCRSWTSSRGAANWTSLLQARVEGVAGGVAEQVRGEHGDEDRHAGDDHEVDRVEEVALRVAEHVAPAGSRRLDAQAEEVERRLDEDDLPDAQAGRDDHHRQHVGQQVLDHKPKVARSDRARGEDEIALLDRQDLAPHQPRDVSPADEGDDHRQRDRVGPKQDRHQDEQEDRGDREDHVDETHQDVLQPAAVVARHQAHARAHRQRHGHGQEGDAEGDATAPDQPRQRVAAQLVGAEQVG